VVEIIESEIEKIREDYKVITLELEVMKEKYENMEKDKNHYEKEFKKKCENEQILETKILKTALIKEIDENFEAMDLEKYLEKNKGVKKIINYDVTCFKDTLYEQGKSIRVNANVAKYALRWRDVVSKRRIEKEREGFYREEENDAPIRFGLDDLLPTLQH
jgi:hypothetical protein